MSERDISDLIDEMRDLPGDDEEDDHIAADRLLCEAVRRLGAEQGRELANAFGAVRKWYA